MAALLSGCAASSRPPLSDSVYSVYSAAPDLVRGDRWYWCEPQAYQGKVVMLLIGVDGVVLSGVAVDRWPVSCAAQLVRWSTVLFKADALGLGERW